MVKRRHELYAFQAHALSDALGVCPGHIHRPGRRDREWRSIPCPLCMGWRRPESLDEDHAPQKAGQSVLGSAHVVVLTCKTDNQTAGRSFEKQAAWYSNALVELPSGICRIHQRERVRPSGLVVPVDANPLALTDVRAAFLVAFATLGIRWAATPRLDRLRQAFRRQDAALASDDFEVVCLCDVAEVQPHHVYEVVAPVPGVLVVGAHAGVLLPCHGSPDRISGTITTVRSVQHWRLVTATERALRFTRRAVFPWPLQFVDPGGTVEKAWDNTHDGNLFHYDRCHEETHHLPHAVPRCDLPGLLIPQDRSVGRPRMPRAVA